MADETEINLVTLGKQYSDEGAAYELVESIRWPNGPVCPHCDSVNHAYFLNPQNGGRKTRTGSISLRRVYKCAECRKQFSVLVGTIFEGSKIPLHKWLLAFHMLASAKNGVAAYELHRTLHISVESAWFMAHRIRHALEGDGLDTKLSGTVEADETYMGGQAKNMHASRRREKFTGGPFESKTPVFTLVQRGGEVRSQVMRAVTGANIREALTRNVVADARLMTDQARTYTAAGRAFAAHEIVNHGAGEYVRGDVHTVVD